MTGFRSITSLAELDAIYHARPTLASTAKVADHLTPHYRKLVDASPFLLLATAGPDGLDCSPRGDSHGLVRVVDDRTLILPDRRGNNRIDSLRNIVRNPCVALLFLIPGSGTTLRINGRACVTADADLLESFQVDGKAPRTVVIVSIEEVYFQCARAVHRADLWNSEKHVDPASLPTPGEILEAMTDAGIDAHSYDTEWPARAKATMW